MIYQLPTTLCDAFLHEVFKQDSIDSLDSETLFTIQRFFENNLNVSETSRGLFVHRNTLVYRLEKIKKLTGLDLRKFDDAIVFKVALMVKKYLSANPPSIDPPTPPGSCVCRGAFRPVEKVENVAVGGHAPTTATPTGKFCGKLCARSVSDECAVCRKILSKGIPKGCGAEHRLWRIQRGGAGAAVAERKRHLWRAARCGHRNPEK